MANLFDLAPDWLIEILSPEQNPIPVIDKILYALDRGTKMGWLIDPNTQTVLVYPAQQQPKLFNRSEDTLPLPEFVPELNLSSGEIFGWLQLS